MGKINKEYRESLGTVKKGNLRYAIEIDESVFEILKPSKVPEGYLREWGEDLTPKDYIEDEIFVFVVDKIHEIEDEINYRLKKKKMESSGSAGSVKNGDDNHGKTYFEYISPMQPILEG